MVELGTATSLTMRTGTLMYKNRHLIQKWLKLIMVACSIGKTQVLILGRSGVGKSVLTSIIHGEAEKLQWKEPGVSQDIEVKPILIGEWTKIATVVPGQDIIERQRALHKHFVNNTLEGMIYVVDWGFTDLRSKHIEQKLVDQGKFETLEQIRNYHLKQELIDFSKVVEQLKLTLSNKKGPKWLMIAVTKFDLFNDNELDARLYYEDKQGEFYSILNDLITSVGEQNFKIRISFVSAQIEDFQWNGVIHKPKLTSSAAHKELLINFINDLAEISV